jgi:hypothetical protein
MIEAIFSSEMSVLTRDTRLHFPEDGRRYLPSSFELYQYCNGGIKNWPEDGSNMSLGNVGEF